MPAGTFARTDETWLILEYVGLDESSTEIVPRQTYLLAPDGTVYVVPLPDDLADGRVLDWYPGSGLVVLGSNLDRYVVDLATGSRATVPADPTVQFLPGGGGDLLEYGYEGSDLTFRRLDQQGQPVRTLASITDADLGQVFVGPGGDALLVEDPLDGPLALSLVDGTARMPTLDLGRRTDRRRRVRTGRHRGRLLRPGGLGVLDAAPRRGSADAHRRLHGPADRRSGLADRRADRRRRLRALGSGLVLVPVGRRRPGAAQHRFRVLGRDDRHPW
jgi:hypothetical protein